MKPSYEKSPKLSAGAGSTHSGVLAVSALRTRVDPDQRSGRRLAGGSFLGRRGQTRSSGVGRLSLHVNEFRYYLERDRPVQSFLLRRRLFSGWRQVGGGSRRGSR